LSLVGRRKKVGRDSKNRQKKGFPNERAGRQQKSFPEKSKKERSKERSRGHEWNMKKASTKTT